MKFSELWLREWVNPNISSEVLSNQITMAGLEVDGVEPVAGVFYGVIVGEVVECYKHPNADKLLVTKVNIGKARLLDIVCGASNCRAGLKVAVATVKTILPGNFKITLTTLRGKLSEGILCAWLELGVLDKHEGIIELPKDAPIGADLREYLQLSDNIITINVTPNRGDCLSVIGIARDISVLNKMALTKPDVSPVVPDINTTLPIRVDTPKSCPRYLGRVIKGINIKATKPLWMHEKLRRSGMISINAVADVINYVSLELGQPMNAFDLQCIEGGIVVRMAKEGERLALLNGGAVKLNTDILVIADEHKALAMGGGLSGESPIINYNTKDLLLECALFNSLSVASCIFRHEFHTNASHQYECGVDPTIQYHAIERATRLIIDICGGQAGPVIDVTHENELPKQAIIQLYPQKMDRLLGCIVPVEQVKDILCRLGFQVTEQVDNWLVVPPSWRFDIKTAEDLVEEVIRVYGYHNVPEIPVHTNLVMTKHSEANLTLERVKTILVDHGFQEVITYSFVDPKVQTLLHPGEVALAVPHPISTEMSVMRLSLWTGLLSAVAYNQHRQQTRLRLFESGRSFVPNPAAALGVCQDIMLSAVITGNTHDEHWDIACKPIDFYDLKGELESIIELTGYLSQIKFLALTHPALHSGQSAAIYLHNECIGYIGMIHPELKHKLNLHGNTMVFELKWEKLARRAVPQVRGISRFPANRRDISIVVPENIAVEDILRECKRVSINQIVDVKLFDVYRGNGIVKGYKSLAITLILQDMNYTLEEKEIATTVAKCVEALRQRFQASLRN